jgi:hypothetical protein
MLILLEEAAAPGHPREREHERAHEHRQEQDPG